MLTSHRTVAAPDLIQQGVARLKAKHAGRPGCSTGKDRRTHRRASHKPSSNRGIRSYRSSGQQLLYGGLLEGGSAVSNDKSASQLESLTYCPKTNGACPLWHSIFRLGYRRPLGRRARTEFPRACGLQRVAKSKPSHRGRALRRTHDHCQRVGYNSTRSRHRCAW